MTFTQHDIEWTPEKSRRLWDYYGSNERYASFFFGYQAGRFVARKLFSAVPLPSDARLLDFSCGRGDVIAACLSRMGPKQEIVATDFSEAVLDHVRARFAGDPRFKGAVSSRELPALPAEERFDVVVATEVIEHLHDDELAAMLTECRRLLKPGGYVFLTTPNDEDYDAARMMCPECGCVYHKWQHVRTWTVETLRARMEQAGFDSRLVAPVSWRSWPAAALDRLRYGRRAANGLVYVGSPAR